MFFFRIKGSAMDKRKTFLILIINASLLIEIKCAENYTRRFDCYPEKKANETLCKKRGCIWSPLTKVPIMYCLHIVSIIVENINLGTSTNRLVRKLSPECSYEALKIAIFIS